MRIFITGGTGFIGSYLTDFIIRKGHSVFVFDKTINFSGNTSMYEKALMWRKRMFTARPVKIFDGDIRKPKETARAMKIAKPDVVVHLAAVTMARPPKKYEHLLGPINLYGTINVLKAFEENQYTRRIIFPSSSLAYGAFVSDPQPENAFLQPVGDYGIMKAACEYTVRLTKKEWVILRPTSVYGFTDCANRVTQLLFDAALTGGSAWVVRGESMDFTYVEDAVQGFYKAITKPGADHEVFNISRGTSRSAEDFARILKRHFPKFTYEVRSPKNQQAVTRGTQDIKKARKILAFKPKYSIEDGIAKTIRLMKKYGQISSI